MCLRRFFHCGCEIFSKFEIANALPHACSHAQLGNDTGSCQPHVKTSSFRFETLSLIRLPLTIMHMVARTGQSLNATAMPLVQASKPAFVDIATLIQRTYSDKNIILVNSHSFEPKLPLFFNVWYGAGNRTAPITLMVTSEVRPLTVRGAYLKTSNASTAVTDSLGVQIPDHALAHFVIAPYFTRHTCNSIQPHINSMRSRRPYRICFVGCIIKHNSYRNAPSPGFEARKTFIRHMNSSSTRIIDLCEQRHDRSPPQGLDSVYSQCDLCL